MAISWSPSEYRFLAYRTSDFPSATIAVGLDLTGVVELLLRLVCGNPRISRSISSKSMIVAETFKLDDDANPPDDRREKGPKPLRFENEPLRETPPKDAVPRSGTSTDPEYENVLNVGS